MASGRLSSKAFVLPLVFTLLLGIIIYNIIIPSLFSLKNTNTLLSYNLQHTMPPLQVGDIIFRQGIGMESLVIETLSNHPYTHIGLVVHTNPTMILHATPDDNPKKPNQVILSSFDEFLSYAQNIAVKRFELPQHIREKIALQATAWLGKPFVLSVDSQALYCTTLLEQILSPHIALNLNYDNVNVPAFKGAYLFPKAFFEDSHSILIYESNP